MSRLLFDRRTTLLGAGSLAALAASPRIARAQGAPRRGGVLTAQTFADLRTLNPALATSYAIHVFTSKMIEPLVDLGPDGGPAPKLATSWESTPDGKTITFKLRQNVQWHDGKPFTSADVQFCAMEMWKKVQNFGTLLHRDLERVDTPDPHTAIFRYASPMPLTLLLRAAAELCYVVPRHVFENTELLRNPANTAPIGTGPYKFVEYQPGQHLIMERNPNYWQAGLPYLDRLIIRVIADASAATAALESGAIQISMFSSLPRTDLVRLSRDSRFRVSTRGNDANTTMNTIGFNTRRRELSDVRVRRAIAHAVDVNFYTEDFLLGYGKRAQGPIPSTSGFFVPGAATDYPFDPRRAEALLDEAGYRRGADGTRLSLRLMPNQSDDIRRFGTFIQQSLQRVGIRLEVLQFDVPGYNARVNRDHDFDLNTDTGTFRGDPGIGTTIWYRSDVPPGTPWSNQFGYKNADLDRITAEALNELDPAKRRAMYGEFVKMANTDIPVWMAMEQVFLSAVSARVQNDHNIPRWTGSSWADVWLAS